MENANIEFKSWVKCISNKYTCAKKSEIYWVIKILPDEIEIIDKDWDFMKLSKNDFIECDKDGNEIEPKKEWKIGDKVKNKYWFWIIEFIETVWDKLICVWWSWYSDSVLQEPTEEEIQKYFN